MRATLLPCRVLKGCARVDYSFAERKATIADPAAGRECVKLKAK